MENKINISVTKEALILINKGLMELPAKETINMIIEIDRLIREFDTMVESEQLATQQQTEEEPLIMPS